MDAAEKQERLGELGRKYRDAREREDELRLAAFIGVSRLRTIAGVSLCPLTLRHMGLLVMARNAHVSPGVSAPNDGDGSAARFWAVHNSQLIWICSEGFSFDAEKRDTFLVKLAAQSFDETFKGINQYLSEELGCSVASFASSSGAPMEGGPSFVAWYVHRFAKAYGWTIKETLDLPMGVIAQLDQISDIEAQALKGKTPVIANPESGRVSAEALRLINQKAE